MERHSLGPLKDPVSGLTHLAGALLGVVGLAYLVWKGVNRGSLWHVVSYSIFGVSLVLLYASSAFYHLLDVSSEARLIFRRIDHTMIFVLIAGSYTPYCLLTLKGPLGWGLLALVWSIAVFGLFLSLFWIEAPRKLTTGIYLAMGWLALVAIYPLARSLTTEGLLWLCMGGAFYTVGAIVYALKRPDPFPRVFGYHEIWHLFVLAGSFSHFLSVSSILE